MLVDVLLYGIGLLFLLTIFMPFSPMTIDLLPVSRERQIWIHRNRAMLWWVVGVTSGVVLLRALGGASDVAALSVLGTASPTWITVLAVTAVVAGMMFWMSYVPLAMSPPAKPRVISAYDANKFVNEDDVVLGVTGGGEARAYPRHTIARPHFFEDTVGGKPLVISYCILCNSGIGFEAALDGRKLSLSCVTAYNNNIIYLEGERPNYIQQLDGAVIDGPDKGKKLALHPLVQTTWREWKSIHPDTKLYYSPSTNMRDKIMDFMLKVMMPVPKLAKRTKPWHRVIGAIDKRLPAMAYSLGVEIGADACGYAVEQVEAAGVVNDSVGGDPIVLVYNQAIQAVEIFSRRVEGRDLTFDRRGDTIVDKETGSTWSLTGNATGGDLRGHQLAAVPHYNKLFWFSWALFKPHTRLYGAG